MKITGTEENLLMSFEKFVQPGLVNPTFVYDYPVEVSPLAKAKKDNPQLAERFELFIGKEEIGNAYSELSDPFEQKRGLWTNSRKEKEEIRKLI